MTSPKANFLKLMSGLIIMMTGLVALSLIATNPHQAQSTITSVARSPASLVTKALAPEKVNLLTEKTLVISMPCSPLTETKVDAKVSQVRLRGRICDQNSPLQSSEIINITNGFRATVFHPAPQVFTSDYIHLSEGRNRLVVNHRLSTGERLSKELAVIRQ